MIPLDPIETLAQLVSIPSVNPMEVEANACGPAESQLTDHLEELFTRLGIECYRQAAEPGRENLVAIAPGHVPAERGGKVILFDAHQDTVPVTGMTIEPWVPIKRNGRLYGRGACDVKGGMAAMLAAVSSLIQKRPQGMATIVIACTVNEENGFTGVQALSQLWKRPGGIIPQARRSDRGRANWPPGRCRPQGRGAMAMPHPRPGRPQCHAVGW